MTQYKTMVVDLTAEQLEALQRAQYRNGEPLQHTLLRLAGLVPEPQRGARNSFQQGGIMENDEVVLRSILEDLVDLFGWSDSTPLHAALHIRNAVLNMRADLAVERARAEKAEANYAFMVERAADQHLGGYRELAARTAAAENEADRLRARLREVAQILIEHTGASSPMDAEDAARKVVGELAKQIAVNTELAACLKWYVEEDDAQEGGYWEEWNAPWLEGKRRAMRALKMEEE